MSRPLRVVRTMAEFYTTKRIPRVSAALSYYLTMTLFPLIICLYSLLGRNYARVLRILNFVEQFLSADASRMIRSFLFHVAGSNSRAILIAAVTVLLTSASAGVRTLQSGIGDMQGGPRFQGLKDFLFSILFSLAFLAATYFGILVLLTGREFMNLINGYLPFVDVSRSWNWMRFPVLGSIEIVIFWGIYEVSKRRTDNYRSFPGALLATAAIVAMSLIFSFFISASTRYPLVYGSLASLILIMFWMYLGCQIIFLGAAFNIALRDVYGGKDTD